MLTTAILDTEAFLSWIEGKATFTTSRMSPAALKKQLSTNFCALVFPQQSVRADTESAIIVVDPGRARDFYAFVSTYLTDYSPFSAFCRVLTVDQIGLLNEDGNELDRRDVLDRVRPFVGAAIAEAAIYTYARSPNGDVKAITLPAAMATFSAAALQGLTLGSSSDIEAIGRNWTMVRSIVGGDQLPLPVKKLSRFWEVVRLALYGGGSSYHTTEEVAITRGLRSVAESGNVTDQMFEEILRAAPHLELKPAWFRGTREERARTIQEAISVLAKGPPDEGQIRDCIAGCLLSRLGDGSFKFLSHALSLSPTLPMAAMWFAAWSGLQKTTDVMTAFNCMGRRIARDTISRSMIYADPVDDISVEELRVLGNDLDTIPKGNPGVISVEIYPNVSSRQRLPRTPAGATNNGEFRQELRALKHLLAQSSVLLAKMDEGAQSNLPGSAFDSSSAYDRGASKKPSGGKRKS